MKDLNIAVVGAGVVGLTTAIELQKQFRNANVTIVADGFEGDTVSAVAAGVFRPGTSFSGPTEEITKKWIDNSFHYWTNLIDSHVGHLAGVTRVTGYIFSSEFPNIVRNRYIEKLVPIYRRATEDELKLCAGNWKYGSFFSSTVTQCTIYLPWAKKQFLDGGGKIFKRKIDSLGSFAGKYDVTVNCTGLGAKYLCNDHKLVPIRGQVFKVKAPWIKHFFYGDYDTYVIPGFDSATLGGCRHYESYDSKFDEHDGAAILERCRALIPSLNGAEIVDRLVGLRPHRDPVRVERETIESIATGAKARVVHNYGHGGYGVTAAPGTAIHACALVKQCLTGNSKL